MMIRNSTTSKVRTPLRGTRWVKRLIFVGLVLSASFGFGYSTAVAHPLGNFTTNTATRLSFGSDRVDVLYIVDMAEIPALKVRQSLGAPQGDVPDTAATAWRNSTCSALGKALSIRIDESALMLQPGASALGFPMGQAGLTTLRLECTLTAPFNYKSNSSVGSPRSVSFADGNFPERLGWREITATGTGARIVADKTTNIAAPSPTELLLNYPTNSNSAPLRQLAASFMISPGESARVQAPSGLSGADLTRGNDGLTQRFQSLIAEREVSPQFAVVAIFVALVLGGLHALAPGHGKTIMAAYAVTRRGRRADVLSIGLTVALTHTIGIIVLGTIISATSLVSSEGALRWISAASGVLVVGVGLSLVRGRLLVARAERVTRRNQGHHEHGHHHDHGEHGHHHDHVSHDAHSEHDQHAGHDVRSHSSDDRFIVTSHSHGGGWQHDHVLPAPGATVRRRELVTMGLAGGMAPSPSALVVLLAAIALGRIPFGLALVGAYGIGLAGTLVLAGLMLVRFERKVTRWTTAGSSPLAARFSRLVEAIPLVSGTAIIGAGLLLVVRSLSLV
jgi:nickel/cobalt transporter (NicO) family protein